MVCLADIWHEKDLVDTRTKHSWQNEKAAPNIEEERRERSSSAEERFNSYELHRDARYL